MLEPEPEAESKGEPEAEAGADPDAHPEDDLPPDSEQVSGDEQ
jgi:hypothetical protein